MLDPINKLLDYIKSLGVLFASHSLAILIASIFTLVVGDKLCPTLYQQHKELIGIFLIISFSVIASSSIRSFSNIFSYWIIVFHNALKNKFNLYRANKSKDKSRARIIESLNHLTHKEEMIIKTMVKNNRNNTSSFGARHTYDLDLLYKQGILCQRDIFESTMFEKALDDPDPIPTTIYDEFTPIRNYKMPNFVWEEAKKNPHFIDDEIPF